MVRKIKLIENNKKKFQKTIYKYGRVCYHDNMKNELSR